MSRRYERLPSLSNVAAGSTATLEIPVSSTFDRIFIEAEGVTEAQLKNWEIRINGKPVQQFKDAVLIRRLNDYYGRGTDDGVVDLWFIRPEFDNQDLRRMTAIGTEDVQTFDIRVDIDSAASSPKLTAYAVRSPQTKLGLVTKIKNYPTSAATAGVKDIDNIPKEGRCAAIHFYGKADISKLTVQADSRSIYELSKSLGEKIQRNAGRTPLGTNGTTVDFVTEKHPLQGLAMRQVNDLRFKPELDTAGALDVIVEYITSFEGL